jgi:hypothetical protein
METDPFRRSVNRTDAELAPRGEFILVVKLLEFTLLRGDEVSFLSKVDFKLEVKRVNIPIPSLLGRRVPVRILATSFNSSADAPWMSVSGPVKYSTNTLSPTFTRMTTSASLLPSFSGLVDRKAMASGLCPAKASFDLL